MKKHLAKILLAALLLVPGQLHADELLLVKDGKRNATIVIAENAPAVIKTAAVDLRRYIKEMSGVELLIQSDKKPLGGPGIFIGPTIKSTPQDLPPQEANPETYVINPRDGNLFLNGRYPTPATFAVYSFLQDNLGVRWFAPGDEWTYVPKPSTPGTLKVEVDKVVSTPTTTPRPWSGHAYTNEWKDWNRRNKLGVSERLVRRNFQNNIYRIFPQSRYGKTHPEYYPLVNGKRWIPPTDGYVYWWPCVGNPAVQKVVLDYIDNFFEKNPHHDSFALGLDDILYMCECPLCRALDAEPEDHARKEYSDRFYNFINLIARETKKKHPDKYIGMLIYSNVKSLPKKVAKLEDNIFGYMTETSALWYDPAIRKRENDLTLEWAKRVKHLSRYDYFGFNSFAPRIYPRLMYQQLQFDKSLGFEGAYVEINTFLPQTAPMMWAFAQLQWNHKQALDTLLNDFYTKMYGNGAKSMQQYFDVMEASWNEMRPGHEGWELRNIVKQTLSVSPEAVRQGQVLLDRAWSEATLPEEKARIDVTRGALQYASYAVFGYDVASRISAAKIQSADDAKQTLELARQLGNIIAEREPFWVAARSRNDLLGKNLTGFYEKINRNGGRGLQTDASPLDLKASTGLITLIDWYRQNQPEELGEATAQLMQALGETSLRDALSGWIWVQQHNPPSLLKNSDFTQQPIGQTTPVEDDWTTLANLASWQVWSRYDNPQMKRVAGKNQKYALEMTTAKAVQGINTSTLIQNVPITPGKKYFGIVWVKGENAAGVSATLRFRNQGGWASGQSSRSASPASLSMQWQPVLVTAEAPADSDAVAFQFSVTDGSIAFADPAFYELSAQ